MTTETQAGAVTSEAGESQVTATAATTATTGEPDAQAQAPNAEGTKDGAKPDETPISYDFKVPEGIELDEKLAAEFKGIAAELKMPAESAQKVVDLFARVRQSEAEAHAKQVEDWGNQTRTDKEIGGDALDVNLAAARKAVDTFGSDAIKSLLDQTGMGNHPEVVRMMVKIGKAISEDGFVKGSPTAQPTAKTFYDNSNMN